MANLRPIDDIIARAALPGDVYADMDETARAIANVVKNDIDNGRVFPAVMETELNNDELSTVTVRIGSDNVVRVTFERAFPLKIVTANA